MPLPYSEIVMEHFQHPHNVGRIDNPDAKAIEGSPACGDMVAVYLQVDAESHRITDIKFESYGCASNIATGSIITDLAKGKTLDEAKEITWKQASEALGGLPPIKTHCSVLAVDGLRAAIQPCTAIVADFVNVVPRLALAKAQAALVGSVGMLALCLLQQCEELF